MTEHVDSTMKGARATFTLYQSSRVHMEDYIAKFGEHSTIISKVVAGETFLFRINLQPRITITLK